MPAGVTCIGIPKKYLYQNYLALPADFGGAFPYPPDTNEAKEVVSDTVFMLKALSGIPWQNPSLPGLLYMQIRYPNGHVMENILADMSPDLGFGSGRTIFDRPIPCPGGSKFFITLDSSISGLAGTGAGTIPVVTNILFEGALRYFLKANGSTQPQKRNPADSAAALPRFYYDSPNQNIMAPEWMISDRDGIQRNRETPVGFGDSSFTYSNTNRPATENTFSEAVPVEKTLVIPVESASAFLCRRIMFQVISTDVPPTFWVRLRSSLSGTLLTDDYVPLQSFRVHKDWFLRPGIQVYVDVFGVSNGGTGTSQVFVYLEGAKRGRVQ
jgi:hypothetical protein